MLGHQREGWVATSDEGGLPHLVPLSVCWYEQRVILATDESSPTARNIASSGRAQLALGDTRDVVLIAAAGEVSTGDVQPGLIDEFARQTGWSLAAQTQERALIRLRLLTVQVWRDLEENMTRRTVMRDGVWLA